MIFLILLILIFGIIVFSIFITVYVANKIFSKPVSNDAEKFFKQFEERNEFLDTRMPYSADNHIEETYANPSNQPPDFYKQMMIKFQIQCNMTRFVT